MKFLLVTAALLIAHTSHAKQFIACDARMNANLRIALLADTTDFSSTEPYRGIFAYDDLNTCNADLINCTELEAPQAFVTFQRKHHLRMLEVTTEETDVTQLSDAGKAFLKSAKLKYKPRTKELLIRAGTKHYVLSCTLYSL